MRRYMGQMILKIAEGDMQIAITYHFGLAPLESLKGLGSFDVFISTHIKTSNQTS